MLTTTRSPCGPDVVGGRAAFVRVVLGSQIRARAKFCFGHWTSGTVVARLVERRRAALLRALKVATVPAPQRGVALLQRRVLPLQLVDAAAAVPREGAPR